jgi:hypothetical protein
VTRRLVALALLAVSLWPAGARAGAWTRDEGRFLVATSYQQLATTSYYGPDFNVIPIRPYTQHVVGLYGELGLVSRWLTAAVEGTLYRRNDLIDQGYTEGVGDFRVGLWTGIVTSPIHLSLGLTLGIPAGDRSPRVPGGDAEAQVIARSLPTGDGEWDVEARLAAGHTFGKKRRWPLEHYVVAELGYWLRTSGFSDAVVYRLELGTKIPYGVVERFWFIVKLTGVESFASDKEASAAFSGLGNGVTYTAYGFDLYGRIYRGLGADVGLDSALRARSIAAGVQLKVGVSYQY